MSSATSIDKVRIESGAAQSGKAEGQTRQGDPDAGFRPWHFFVLVSLAASTAAVLLSRRSSPEHLILLSFTIGDAGLAAAALYLFGLTLYRHSIKFRVSNANIEYKHNLFSKRIDVTPL